MGTVESMSSTTAMAEPKPMRLVSPMMLLVTSVDSSSRPFRPRLMMKGRSKARSDSMTVMTTTTMLMGRRTGKTTRKKVCRSLAPSMACGFAQRRVHGLEPGQVDDHHVAHVPPARGHEDGPQVEAGVAPAS